MISTCYYCNKNFSDPNFVATVILYKKLETDYSLGLTGLKKKKNYLKKSFPVNRCETFSKIHHTSNLPTLIFSVIIMTVVALYLLLIYKSRGAAIIVTPLAGITAAILYIYFTYRRKIKKYGMKDLLEIDEHPEMKFYLQDGWQIIEPV
jgi:hypothetical protein